MTIGPLELVVLGFEGGTIKGEVAAAIEDAVDSGAIRLIDLVLVKKEPDGTVSAIELEQADEAYAALFEGVMGDLHDVLTEDEAVVVGNMLPPDTSAIVALIEHTWSTHIAQAVEDAGGRLLASQRISPRLIDDVRSELEGAMAAPASH